MQFNWIDFVIIAVILYEVYGGWERGFTTLLVHLGSFLSSLWLAIRFHRPVGNFFVEKFGISSSWTDVLGYVGIALVSYLILEELLFIVANYLPEKLHGSKVNHWLGSALSGVNTVIVVSFFLILMLSLPLRGTVKQDIRSSVIGRRFVVFSERYGGALRSSLNEIAKDAVKFLTVKPGSKDRIPLDIPKDSISFTIDTSSESQMVLLVNASRTKAGVPMLTIENAITQVARRKSADMFERRYFSHYDPDGKNASDRMSEARVPFTIIGENLAYAPDGESAHEGLMESIGHRANILDPRFHRIGIGVIDGGMYGKMFTQVFAD